MFPLPAVFRLPPTPVSTGLPRWLCMIHFQSCASFSRSTSSPLSVFKFPRPAYRGPSRASPSQSLLGFLKTLLWYDWRTVRSTYFRRVTWYVFMQPWNNQDIERALDPQKFIQAPLWYTPHPKPGTPCFSQLCKWNHMARALFFQTWLCSFSITHSIVVHVVACLASSFHVMRV